MINMMRSVYQQLITDFPATALKFVKHTVWVGPKLVPLDMIDFEHRANWAASHEPDKVKLHQSLIKQNKSAPIILGKISGNPKLVCLDAHHRLLAYEALGQSPLAYIGNIQPQDTEAALTMHSSQYSGKSKLDGGQAPSNKIQALEAFHQALRDVNPGVKEQL